MDQLRTDLAEEFDLADMLATPSVFGNYSLNVEDLELLPDLVEAVESDSVLLWADMSMFCTEDATPSCSEMSEGGYGVVVNDAAQFGTQIGDQSFSAEGNGTSADGCCLSPGEDFRPNPEIFHDQLIEPLFIPQPSIVGAFACSKENALNLDLPVCDEDEDFEELKDLLMYDSVHGSETWPESYDVREVEQLGLMSNVVGMPTPIQTSEEQFSDSQALSCVDEPVQSPGNTMRESDISQASEDQPSPEFGKQSVLIETGMEESGELHVDWKVEKERLALRILGKKAVRTSELETELDMEVTKFEELWSTRVHSLAPHENILEQFRKTVTTLLNRYCQQQNKRICYLPHFGVEKLKKWVHSDQHYDHPYPTREEIRVLAEEIGLTSKQVEQWFENYRIRSWKHGTRESKRGRFFRYPPEKTSILKDWIKTNNRTSNSTPQGDALASLVAATGMDSKQVKQWCYNYRRRHKAELDQINAAIDESTALRQLRVSSVSCSSVVTTLYN